MSLDRPLDNKPFSLVKDKSKQREKDPKKKLGGRFRLLQEQSDAFLFLCTKRLLCGFPLWVLYGSGCVRFRSQPIFAVGHRVF
jgi:hypothetical protein